MILELVWHDKMHDEADDGGVKVGNKEEANTATDETK